VTVEVDVRAGLPSFSIIGLADTAVREARERVRTAILNSGFEFPARRITANLAPGDVPKAGPGLDLALACAILGATGQLPRERLDSDALLGELGLDGSVKPARGTLAVADAARRAGLQGIALAPAGAHEARLVDGLRISVVERLDSAVRVLRGGRGDPLPPAPSSEPARNEPDLADVRGQDHAVRALVIAAAGGHNLLLSGAPGTGKTMLALRAPSILPRLSAAEALEVTRIESLAGVPVRGLRERPPFRAPHHTITVAGLIGGARGDAAGEAVLAHNGVLFLDELSEFERSTLQALRQPLEEGRVVIARARHRAAYPARFMLLAATNPCPCGFAGEHERCTCTESELALHRRRIGGPLLDRIDLFAALVRERAVAPNASSATSSRHAREQVREARARQRRRLRHEPVSLNAQLDASMLERHLGIEHGARELVLRGGAAGLLSARGQQRVLRVARTIADLAGRDRVAARHVGAALALRPQAAGAREDCG
jgi:magnesium chelatase family protein